MDALGFTIQKNKDGSYFLIRRKFNQKFGPYKVKSPAELQPIIKKLRYEGVSSDSVDAIAEKYGREIAQTDAADPVQAALNAVNAERSKVTQAVFKLTAKIMAYNKALRLAGRGDEGMALSEVLEKIHRAAMR